MASRRTAAVKAIALALAPDQTLAAAPPQPAFAARAPAAPPSMPARGLQDLLETAIQDRPGFARAERRWSPRRMLAFTFAASGLLWCAIGAGVYLLIRGA